MLRATGHAAAILDGGITAYAGELETDEPVPKAASFTPRPWPTALLADIDEVTTPGLTVVDARSANRFDGRQDPIDPRPGHIPGAVDVPCRANLDTAGRLLPLEDIRRRLEATGVEGARGVISYCGSGVTVCHNLLVLEDLGMGQGRLYVGGWSQYGHASDRPVETAASG